MINNDLAFAQHRPRLRIKMTNSGGGTSLFSAPHLNNRLGMIDGRLQRIKK